MTMSCCSEGQNAAPPGSVRRRRSCQCGAKLGDDHVSPASFIDLHAKQFPFQLRKVDAKKGGINGCLGPRISPESVKVFLEGLFECIAPSSDSSVCVCRCCGDCGAVRSVCKWFPCAHGLEAVCVVVAALLGFTTPCSIRPAGTGRIQARCSCASRWCRARHFYLGEPDPLVDDAFAQ